MTHTNKNIELASRLASVIELLPNSNFSLRYDAEGDVAYLSFGDAQSAIDSELLGGSNLIVRYGEADEIIGLTLLNVSKWQQPNPSAEG